MPDYLDALWGGKGKEEKEHRLLNDGLDMDAESNMLLFSFCTICCRKTVAANVIEQLRSCKSTTEESIALKRKCCVY